MGQKHAERTLPEIERLLQQADIALSGLDAIVFGQGPGSFTGLRIACGLAQGLAFSAGCPSSAFPPWMP
jgi:tRNA threonylcarbamoyladenosine biosynthesis protein TsaB